MQLMLMAFFNLDVDSGIHSFAYGFPTVLTAWKFYFSVNKCEQLLTLKFTQWLRLMHIHFSCKSHLMKKRERMWKKIWKYKAGSARNAFKSCFYVLKSMQCTCELHVWPAENSIQQNAFCEISTYIWPKLV